MTALARSTDPDTSHAAAVSLSDLRPKQQAVHQVLAEFSPDGATDVELVGRYRYAAAQGWVPQQSASGIRSRRAELVTTGHVTPTGTLAVLESGRHARVWRVVP